MKIKFLNAFLILAGLFIFLVVVETQLSFSDASRHCENNVRKFVKDIDEAYKTQNIEALEKLAYLARACYKDGELQSEIKTKIKIFEDNNKTTFPNQNINTKDNISIFPQSQQDKISAGGISTNNPFNQPYIGGVQGQEQGFGDSVYLVDDTVTKDLKYKDAPYHGTTGNSIKSARPTDGQKVLNNSLQIKPTSERRIGVDKDTGEFVVFDETLNGEFHGHTRSWNELTTDMKNVLIKSGQVKRNGKIIK